MTASNLITRTCTGAAYVAVVLTGIHFQSHCYALSLVAGVCALIGLAEFYRMGNRIQDIRIPVWSAACAGMLPYLACALHACAGWNWVWLLLPLPLAAVYITALYDRGAQPVLNLAYLLLGQLLVALPLGSLSYLSTRHDIVWTFALFVLIWTNDTGAYLTGSLLGRHKLFERVSPKKSWEGSVGGAVFTLVAGLLFWRFSGIGGAAQWTGLSLLTVVAGTYGDLLESLLKRSAGVKDSGKILPGHGGILDRFDSILLAAPVALAYLEIIRPL